MRTYVTCCLVTGLIVVLSMVPGRAATRQQLAGQPPSSASWQGALLDRYCVSCHNETLRTGGLALDTLDVANVPEGAEIWEKAVRKLRGGLMPPLGRPRPDAATYDRMVTWLETELDRGAEAQPNPGRTETFHRLNRAEYGNVIRDLLALDVDVAELLPSDNSSYGFDNMAGVLKINQSLLERYLLAARKVSRLAVGRPPSFPAAETFRVPIALPQYDRLDGFPFGTRGGTRIRYTFPVDAEYTINVELVGGANNPEPHELEVSIDGERVKLFTVKIEQRGAYDPESDPEYEVRVRVTAGPHDVVVTFLRKSLLVVDGGSRLPFTKPRTYGGSILEPFVGSVTITGPFDMAGSGDTPSRRRIFSCRPTGPADEERCAKEILSTLARRAYRRPVTELDLERLLPFYTEGRSGGGFDAGIDAALRRLLVSPEFLFRIAADPPNIAPNTSYRIGDLELASRLSFLLWSSIPDDELLDLAARGLLSDQRVLEQQMRRMLVDTRAEALVDNFFGQWLQLRNLELVAPDDNLFPNFDDGLREAFRKETALFLDSILREDRSVLELLTADYTFVNERLAKHYDIPNVKGSHFRRITLVDERRRGILGHGSILVVTSRPNRTSPVLRGMWILENILRSPPPDPPANVPPLEEKTTGPGRVMSVRERMAAHRSDPVCASCHAMIDPPGFALEGFDAVGRWRDIDESLNPIDTSGTLPGGLAFDGVVDFRDVLLNRSEAFVTVIAEKLLSYALGRGLEYYDMPTVRSIVNEAAKSDYRFSALVRGVVKSVPFQMRRSLS